MGMNPIGARNIPDLGYGYYGVDLETLVVLFELCVHSSRGALLLFCHLLGDD